jgi:Tol biopolymer transport system component
LESGCEVVLSYMAASEAGSSTVGLEVEKGDTSFQAPGSTGVQSLYEVLTPAATVSVASGRCRVRVLEDGETVVEVSEGAADVLARDTVVEVLPGEYASVMPGRAPSVPRPVVARFAFVSERMGNPDIWLLDEQGDESQLTFDVASDLAPVWSPDGARIAFETDRDGNSEIYVMESDGSNPVNLTRNPADDHAPAWSPDGARIAFQSERDGTSEIYLMNADGTEQVRQTFGPGVSLAPRWESSGSGIAYSRAEGDTNGDGLLDPRDMAGYLLLPTDGGSPGVLWSSGEILDQMVFPWGHRAVR